MRDRPKLLPAVATLLGAATMALLGYEMVRSAASSIFLAHHPASRLTEALMLVPPAMIVLTLAVSWLLRRFGPSATYALTLVVSGLLLAAAAFAARRNVPGSAFVLYIFAQAYIVLIVEQSWAFINSLFTTDDGKRWNGIIIAVTTAGSVTGGVLTGLLSERIGSEQIVVCAAALTAAAALVSRRAFRQAGPERTAADRQPERLADHFAWDLLRSDPTLGRLALIVVASQSISVLFDIAFHRSLQIAMPLQEPRTAFLGYFFGGVNAVAFMLQVGLCPGCCAASRSATSWPPSRCCTAPPPWPASLLPLLPVLGSRLLPLQDGGLLGLPRLQGSALRPPAVHRPLPGQADHRRPDLPLDQGGGVGAPQPGRPRRRRPAAAALPAAGRGPRRLLEPGQPGASRTQAKCGAIAGGPRA